MSRNLIGFAADPGYLLESMMHIEPVFPRPGKGYDFIALFRGGEAHHNTYVCVQQNHIFFYQLLVLWEIHGYELQIYTAASPILDMANLQIACTTHLSKYLEAHHPMFRFGLIGYLLNNEEDGLLASSLSGPGLGVDIDWDWMDNHTVDKLKGCSY